jgi:hypothetical protein
VDTTKYDDYEREYFALHDEAELLVIQMKKTGDSDARYGLRQQLLPIDKRRYELDCLMNDLRRE